MPNVRDLVFVSGLAMSFAGIWLVSPPAALVVTGYTLIGAAAVGLLRRGA